MRRLEIFVLSLFICGVTSSARGHVVSEALFFSKNFGTNRFVRIYLPPGYEHDTKKRYPVLYLHDGQNVFSTVGTNVAFGWGNWQLDLTVDDLITAGKMRPIIMVAIDCSAERYLDYRGPAYSYSPSELKKLQRPPAAAGDNSRWEKYKRFLIDELKPRIDRDYRTLKEAKNTGSLGSSMGGIASLALSWEHPKVFGLAASLSGAYQVERKNFLKILQDYDGKTKPFRIYLDSGVIDYSGGDDGRKNTEAVADELRRIGWRDGKNLVWHVEEKPLTDAEMEQAGLRHDKRREAKTSQHNEFYWRLRAWRALEFLFPPIEKK